MEVVSGRHPSEKKRAIIVVSIPVGSNGLEQQVPGRRCIAHIVHPTVDNRDANEERRGFRPPLLQRFRVLCPGRTQILLVDGIAERGEHLRW